MRRKWNILHIIFLFVFLLSTRTAYALYYFGGNSDGYAVVSSASQPSIVSAATQTFTFGDGSTAMSALTITNYPTPSGGYISAANGIRVVIPSDLAMSWDTSYTTATITGSASGKVSTTVSYPNSKTLLITVSSDFVVGDTITVSGLQFKTFTGPSYSGLWLSIDGGSTNLIQDAVPKTVIYPPMFLGGNGDGYGPVSSASQPTIVSAATQTFTFGDGSTAMSAVTITNYTTSLGANISAASGIRVVIPSDLAMSWDTSFTTATITGSASGKVSTTVSYPDSKTLLITVSSDFVLGDTITVSGLQFKTFTGPSTSRLWLSIDGGITLLSPDLFQKIVIYPGMFLGGIADGYSTATAYFDRVNGFLGGNGRGEAMVIAGSRAVMTMMSAAKQSFTVADPTTLMSALSITQQFSSANGVLTANGIRVKIPAALAMTWDSSVTAATVSGGASGKVSTTVSYENSDKTLVIAATTNFADGDTITVSGLKFKNFTASGDSFLQLEIDNAGTTIEADPYDKFVLVVERSTGFLGGIGRGEIEGDINQGPPANAIFFGTMF